MADLPALTVAAAVWVYWARVGAMSWRRRRRTRKLAGVLPEQRLEIGMWMVWIPLVVAWMVLPYLAAMRPRGIWALPVFAQSQPALLTLRWVAALGAIACLIATIRCWKRMGRHWKMSVTPGEESVLITDGPFERVRHPIYGYSILLMLCTLVAVPTLPMLLIALVHIAMMVLKARNEEAFLLRQHGDAYARYVERTGRFFRVGRRRGSQR